MTASPIRFGIAGSGMIAGYHAEAIAQTPGARLSAVCRSNPARAGESQDRFGVPCEASYEALLARDDIDVVCICTPSGLHAQQAIAAMRAGKHVLVEKPMALTLESADEMIAVSRETGVLLGVVLQRRTDPSFQAVRAAIEMGKLGRLTLGNVSIPYFRPQSYYESADWRGTWALDGGGALMNQGIHLLDMLVWYMGDATEVQATADTLAHQIEVEDCITATIRFANGALGSLMATTAAAPGFPHRVEVYGTRGGVQIEGETVARWETEAGSGTEDGIALSPAAGPVSAGAGADPAGISVEGHMRLIENMVAAIKEGTTPFIPGEEGRRSLALALAIYEAARTRQVARPG